MSDLFGNNSEEKKQNFKPITLPDFGSVDFSKFAPPPPAKKNEPEYILNNVRGRDLYGRLSFNTGVLWLGGFTAGSAYGIAEGFRNANSSNYKVVFNSCMNGISKRGSTLGSSLGILGKKYLILYISLGFNFSLLVAFMHTTGIWAADQLELDNLTGTSIATPLFAGVTTGALYKSTRGPRAAALAAVIGGTVSCAYWFGGSYLYNVVLGRSGRY